MDSISTDTWCSASGAITDRAILVTPAACAAAPLGDGTFSTSQVASATCRNSDGGSSAGQGAQAWSGPAGLAPALFPCLSLTGSSTKVRSGLETGAVFLPQVLLLRPACLQGLRGASGVGLSGIETSQLGSELRIQTELGSNPSLTIYFLLTWDK